MPERPPFNGLDPDLLDRYLAGECSEAETAVVRRWFMAHAGESPRLAEYLARLDSENTRPPAPDVASSWQAIKGRIDAEEPAGASRPTLQEQHEPARPSRQSVRSHWGRPAVAAAAGIVLVAGLGYFASRDRAALPPAAPPYTYTTAVRERSGLQLQVTYTTAVRGRSDLRLPDGTRVHLAPRSRLRIATDFGVDRRDVYLDGEGYFEVVHDKARPFTVFAGSTSVRDIGTAFSVRSYSADSAVRVVVREGEVMMLGVGRLLAGDVGRVTAAGTTSVERGVAVDALLAWTAGRLVYADAPLGTVLEDLNYWYGAEVHLADSSNAGLLFTGVLANVTPAEAVEQVAAALGLDIQRRDGRVLLAPNPRKTPRTR